MEQELPPITFVYHHALETLCAVIMTGPGQAHVIAQCPLKQLRKAGWQAAHDDFAKALPRMDPPTIQLAPSLNGMKLPPMGSRR
jgi:hypothetical protein